MQNNYFLSSVPCYLKVNGNYVGEVDSNLKRLEDSSRLQLLEFLPKNTAYYPVYGKENGDYLRVFKVEDGILYHPVFLLKKNLSIKVIFQKSEIFAFGEILLTCAQDGDIKIFLDGYISDVKTLPFIPSECEIKHVEDFLVVLIKGVKTAVFLYGISSRKLCFSDVSDTAQFSSVLTLEKRYETVTKTTLKETWSLSNEVKLLSLESKFEKPYRLVNENLLPLAFFENACLGADLQEISTPEFYKKTPNLKSFLGNVISAVMSPVNDKEVWLIQNDLVVKGSIKTKGNLVDNVILDDF